MAGRAAAVLSAQLVLAHAANELIPSFASTDQKQALRAWAREQGQRILDEVPASVTAPPDAVTGDLREGRATHELAALCDERRPVLAVVGLIVKTATNEDAA
jgi:hypothetical protein